MTKRIALWVLAGIVVASGWVYYSFLRGPVGPNLATWGPLLITAPAALLTHVHRAITFYVFVLANGAVYGLVGALVELARLPFRHTLPKPVA